MIVTRKYYARNKKPVLAPVKTNTLASTDSTSKKRKPGFMQGEMTLPDDINWGDEQIQDLFEGNE